MNPVPDSSPKDYPERRQEVQELLEKLREVLKSGPTDRFRSSLRNMITEILYRKRPLKDLADGLRPLLKDVALSWIEAGRVREARSALSALRACRSK